MFNPAPVSTWCPSGCTWKLPKSPPHLLLAPQVLADILSVPPLLTGSQLHVNGSYSSKGTMEESEHAQLHHSCVAHRESDSKDDFFHAVGINGHVSGSAAGYKRNEVQVMAPLLYNPRCTSQLQFSERLKHADTVS